MKQHKWHKEIKAWADGAEIEFKANNGKWFYVSYPVWNCEEAEYRIKPQPKEPKYLYVYGDDNNAYEFKTKPKVDYDYIYIGKIKLEVDDDN